MRDKNIEKKFEELCDMFYSNISLFIQKQDIILNDPQLYNIRSPRTFFSGAHIGIHFSTLEMMLSFWKNETCFSECKCGGQTVAYHISNSNLSGSFIYKICLQCGNISRTSCEAKYVLENFNKYKSENDNCETITIEELIKFLQNGQGNFKASLKNDTKGFPSYLRRSI